jgi:REP element-mobilizing transposase RayT
MPDHVPMLIAIPPKFALSYVVGFIKGKEHDLPSPSLRKEKA